MRLLVTGADTYDAWLRANTVLDLIHRLTPISLLIEGGAKGADQCVRNWAANNSVHFITYKADWANVSGVLPKFVGTNKFNKPYNKVAGIDQIKKMLSEGRPSLVLALDASPAAQRVSSLATERDFSVLRNTPLSGPVGLSWTYKVPSKSFVDYTQEQAEFRPISSDEDYSHVENPIFAGKPASSRYLEESLF